MSALTSKHVLRPAATGLKGLSQRLTTAAMPWFFCALRRVRPITKFGSMLITSRYDDVREVFAEDSRFGVVYGPKLDVIMGGEAFFLGMGNTSQYQQDIQAMRKVILPGDLPQLGEDVQALAERLVAEASGRIDVVEIVRRVTFDVLGNYFGVPEPAGGDLRVWATRLFEFQFADQGNDDALRREVEEIAPAMRAHIDAEISRRRASPEKDDVLGRCLVLQRAGEQGFSDLEIRTALMGFIVGGPPQPPMVVPQAMEQLLRRPRAFTEAMAAARADDDARLYQYVREAMRFDPLAPGLPRVALKDCTIAQGTRREVVVSAGTQVLAAFASAMMDSRRVSRPSHFEHDRSDSDYIHFGYGLHECFGRHINQATLHLMLKPLLKRSNLRRAPGRKGRLSKNGPFAERLILLYD